MSFNFNTSRVKCSKLGFKVHVIKALIGMKEKEGREPGELEVMSKAIDYIKSLEAEVIRLESGHGVVINATSVNVSGDSKEFEASVHRSLIGRLFLGDR